MAGNLFFSPSSLTYVVCARSGLSERLVLLVPIGVKTLPLEGLILLLMGTLRLLLSRSDMLVAANFLFREDTKRNKGKHTQQSTH